MTLLKEWNQSHKKNTLMEKLDESLTAVEQETADHPGRKRYMKYSFFNTHLDHQQIMFTSLGISCWFSPTFA